MSVDQLKPYLARPSRRTFLGYSFTFHKEPKLRVPKESIQRFKSNCKQLLRLGRRPWWNSGLSHMNDAFRKKYFDNIGLVCMLDKLYMLRVS